MKRSFRLPFVFIIGVTFSGFLFSLHFTRNRDVQNQSHINNIPIKANVSGVPNIELPLPELPVVPKQSIPLDEPLENIIPVVKNAPKVIQEQEDCYCVSETTGKKHNFCYVDPQNSTSIGLKFSCDSLKHLENLKLVDNPGPFVNLTDSAKNEEEIVFCSALSDNHLNEGIGSLEAFRKFNPNRKIIIYGLQLNKFNSHYFETQKNVEFRQFNTSVYPEYVNNWMEYRFKPLILAEVMKEYSNIWWLDAHILVKKPNMTHLLFEEIEEAQKNSINPLPSPILFFIHASHSNFAVLFPQLLEFFPSNSIDLLKNEQHGSQLGANTFFIARTEISVEIFKWWILCALDKTCMNPPGAQVYCKFDKNRFDFFAHCFR